MADLSRELVSGKISALSVLTRELASFLPTQSHRDAVGLLQPWKQLHEALIVGLTYFASLETYWSEG